VPQRPNLSRSRESEMEVEQLWREMILKECGLLAETPGVGSDGGSQVRERGEPCSFDRLATGPAGGGKAEAAGLT
jgi:hypothetical protein